MANSTSMSKLSEQLKRAQIEKQEIERQLAAVKEGTKKGCLAIIGVSLVGGWIMSAAVMHKAPADIKSMTFWTFFIGYSVVGCFCLFISMKKRQNGLDEKSYSVRAEVRRIERECEKLDTQKQLAKGEHEQLELENQLKVKQDHLKYLHAFCDLFAYLGAENTSVILAPVTEELESTSKALSVKKAQNATLKNKCRSY